MSGNQQPEATTCYVLAGPMGFSSGRCLLASLDLNSFGALFQVCLLFVVFKVIVAIHGAFPSPCH